MTRMFPGLQTLRSQVLQALQRNAEAAARLLDTRPAARTVRTGVARSRLPSNGRGTRGVLPTPSIREKKP
jgi:hypothetical protein